ncbi:STAS domain-containing protein [Phormidium tenue FACHB-886]|nr:STAS domain-containing protein [Phormidium tenue FACHB-886]
MALNLQIIKPSGILDGTQANHFRTEVAEAVDSGSNMILVNLKDVPFMDSSGLAALVLALKTVRAAGGKLCVCSVNDQVHMLFELTSMNRVFEIFADQEAFNQAFGF